MAFNETILVSNLNPLIPSTVSTTLSSFPTSITPIPSTITSNPSFPFDSYTILSSSHSLSNERLASTHDLILEAPLIQSRGYIQTTPSPTIGGTSTLPSQLNPF
ncbi:hypothetical protein M5689_011099 [Euphorbia peplus]|nr:hypothetical protein M5689_011099 [Euphorbia peplus]